MTLNFSNAEARPIQADKETEIQTNSFGETSALDGITINALLRMMGILILLIIVSTGTNIFLVLRKADRIVIDKASGRVVELNNRDYGATESVEITPDRPNDLDKKYLVREFLKAFYEVEQTTRETQVNKLLRMLDADVSLSLATKLKTNGLLAIEKAESVNSTWELQDLTVDERDPYVLRAIGTRKIRRSIAGGEDVEESVQLKCKFLLKDSPDSPARSDNNLRTGFTILRFRVEPVSEKQVSPVMLLADGTAAGDGNADAQTQRSQEQAQPVAGMITNGN